MGCFAYHYSRGRMRIKLRDYLIKASEEAEVFGFK